jgi:hypothetical protein
LALAQTKNGALDGYRHRRNPYPRSRPAAAPVIAVYTVSRFACEPPEALRPTIRSPHAMNRTTIGTLLWVRRLAVASLLLAGRPAHTQTLPTLPQPPDGEAVVYIFRQRAALGLATRWPVAVNGDYLADLHNANYVFVKVPAGPVSVATLAIHTGELRWPQLRTSGTTCGGLDWRKLGLANESDVESCANTLRGAWGEINGFLRGGRIPAGRHPSFEILCGSKPVTQTRDGDVEFWTVHDVTSCQSELSNALVVASSPSVLRLNAESGRAYYVRMFGTLSSCKQYHSLTLACVPGLTLVDSATAEKESSLFQAAKERR